MAATLDLRCDYCGLPVRGVGADQPQYCCYGCRVASAITQESGEAGHTRWQLTRLGLAIFFTMNVMVFTLALWSWSIYEDEALASHQAAALAELLRYASLLLASIVTVLLGVPLFDNAFENLRRREITADLLIVAGVVAALAYSLISVLTGGEHTYFEVACMVLVGVTVGRWLEAVGKLKTTNAIRSLEKLLPDRARLVIRDAGRGVQDTVVPLDEIEAGRVIRVLPGERIPADGIIRRGQAAIDEKIVTGESAPAVKQTGQGVFAGTLNEDGDLFIEVTASPRGGALLRIIDAVTAAATAKSRLQTTADRVASWFVPSVMVTAAATFAVHASTGGIGSGLMAALAVLLIACPCALGIATPLAIWAAMGRASSAGVLFRHGDALERLAVARVICFDKTGTLTTGETVVDELVVDRETAAEDVLTIARGLAASSTHPFSAAIGEYAAERQTTTTVAYPVDLESYPGRGVVAKLGHASGASYLGSLAMMEDAGLRQPEWMPATISNACQAGKPIACLGWGGQVRAVFSFREQLREETRRSLNALQASGFHLAVLTGDYAARAASLQHSLGVPVEAGLLPEQKLAVIRDLRHSYGPVVMVGDGINDAPALAEADVGIAMGCGAEISRESADVCLLGDNLEQVGWSVDLARRTMKTVRQNLFWAFSYNALGIVLAVAGLLNPIWAAVAMVGSSLFVISNSLRLAPARDLEPQATQPTDSDHSAASVSSCSIVPASP